MSSGKGKALGLNENVNTGGKEGKEKGEDIG